jgi:hypothetical protein
MVTLKQQWVAQYESHYPPNAEWELDRDSADIVYTWSEFLALDGVVCEHSKFRC